MKKFKPAVVIFDVDGVLTPGNFFYTTEGKVMKEFGPDDHDAILLLRPCVDVYFVSGDRKGFEITRTRVEIDMKAKLELVSTVKRLDWMAKHWPLEKIIYMGDGIFDNWVFQKVGYSICPSDGSPFAKRCANFVTESPGGRRAVAEACLHILETFFEPYDPSQPPRAFESSGEWDV